MFQRTLTYLERLKKNGLARWFTFMLVSCLCISFILSYMGMSPNVLYYLNKFLNGNDHLGQGDSWTAMTEALKYLKAHPDQSVYDAMFAIKLKFQYPLSSLLMFDIPNRLFGWSYWGISNLLDLISRISVVATGLVSAKILTLVLQEKRFEKLQVSSRTTTVALYVLVLALMLLFYPLLRSYYLGQIQTILTLFTVLAILCWQYNRRILAGALIGLICVVKPQLGVLFVWGLLRKQWKMFFAGMAVLGLFSAISIGFYGFKNNLQYLEVLSYLSHHGETYYPNQSINGLVNRFTFNGLILDWDGTFPPYSDIVYFITLISSAVIMIVSVGWNYKTKYPHIIDFCLIILCTTIASPIAWEHHYSILFPIFVILSPYACYYNEDKKFALLLFGFGFLLASQYFEAAKYLADSRWNVLQSYLFFGAIIIVAFLFQVSYKINLKRKEELEVK